MDRLLTVSSLLSISLIIVILNSLRRSHIRVEYSLSWLAASVTILVLSNWTWALGRLADLFGIVYPPAAMATIVFCVFLVVLYRLSMIVSELKDNNVALAQKVAALEFHLHEFARRNEAQ